MRMVTGMAMMLMIKVMLMIIVIVIITLRLIVIVVAHINDDGGVLLLSLKANSLDIIVRPCLIVFWKKETLVDELLIMYSLSLR